MLADSVAEQSVFGRFRFLITAVNFRATDYVDLIDWQACYMKSPPVLREISFRDILKMIQDDVPMNGWDFIEFPSHIEAVERILKLATEASRKTVGPQNRDGFNRIQKTHIKI
ncbi:hypothetical protein AVEN_41559-1 [Araneus ventricosus]|uniref:Uncharacterized protein n=1 Tax=Araneus ventricosus TaxID=182803 RepID=A0A4Y2RC72_ARAVE|nr:hypothetical protein AVEN_41559-1 [Araneus ventricosus]